MTQLPFSIRPKLRRKYWYLWLQQVWPFVVTVNEMEITMFREALWKKTDCTNHKSRSFPTTFWTRYSDWFSFSCRTVLFYLHSAGSHTCNCCVICNHLVIKLQTTRGCQNPLWPDSSHNYVVSFQILSNKTDGWRLFDIRWDLDSSLCLFLCHFRTLNQFYPSNTLKLMRGYFLGQNQIRHCA